MKRNHPVSFGRFLRERRESIGLAIDAASSSSGIPVLTWAALEENKRDLHGSMLLGLLYALQMTPREFLNLYLNCKSHEILYAAGLPPERWRLDYVSNEATQGPVSVRESRAQQA